MILTMYEPDNLSERRMSVRVMGEAGIWSGYSYSLLGRKKVIILAIVLAILDSFKKISKYLIM